MSDAYRQMLDAVRDAVTGLSTTGANVYDSPAVAIDSGALPALAVQADRVEVIERWESPDSDDHLEQHRLFVAVVTVALSPDQRDQSALEVKHALLNAARPGDQRRYSRSEFEERGQGDRPLWAVGQHFEVDYRVVATAPDAVVT